MSANSNRRRNNRSNGNYRNNGNNGNFNRNKRFGFNNRRDNFRNDDQRNNREEDENVPLLYVPKKESSDKGSTKETSSTTSTIEVPIPNNQTLKKKIPIFRAESDEKFQRLRNILIQTPFHRKKIS